MTKRKGILIALLIIICFGLIYAKDTFFYSPKSKSSYHKATFYNYQNEFEDEIMHLHQRINELEDRINELESRIEALEN